MLSYLAQKHRTSTLVCIYDGVREFICPKHCALSITWCRSPPKPQAAGPHPKARNASFLRTFSELFLGARCCSTHLDARNFTRLDRLEACWDFCICRLNLSEECHEMNSCICLYEHRKNSCAHTENEMPVISIFHQTCSGHVHSYNHQNGFVSVYRQFLLASLWSHPGLPWTQKKITRHKSWRKFLGWGGDLQQSEIGSRYGSILFGRSKPVVPSVPWCECEHCSEILLTKRITSHVFKHVNRISWWYTTWSYNTVVGDFVGVIPLKVVIPTNYCRFIIN